LVRCAPLNVPAKWQRACPLDQGMPTISLAMNSPINFDEANELDLRVSIPA
jgi:hypothetical protein